MRYVEIIVGLIAGFCVGMLLITGAFAWCQPEPQSQRVTVVKAKVAKAQAASDVQCKVNEPFSYKMFDGHEYVFYRDAANAIAMSHSPRCKCLEQENK